jgi:hypothetical protein
MTKKKRSAKPRVRKPAAEKSAKQKIVQEALQTTWLLKGKLKSAQIAYLKIAELLIRVRDQNLYAELKHPTLEDYAEKRLNLRRASRYLHVYEWVKEFHPAWLADKPQGFIPELSDVNDLIWIEQKLKEKGLTPRARSELEALRDKALSGQLKDYELAAWQRKGSRAKEDVVKKFLSSTRALRRRGAKLDQIPAEAIAHLDAAIKLIEAAQKTSP